MKIDVDKLNQAKQLFHFSRYQEAAKLFIEILKSDSTNQDALLHLAVIHFSNGHNEQAIAAFEQLEPGNHLTADVLSMQAVAYRRVQRIEESRQTVSRALAVQPQHIDALTLAGEVALDLNEVSEAISYFESVISLKPFAPTAIYHLTTLHIQHRYALTADLKNSILNVAAGATPEEDRNALLHYAAALIYKQLDDLKNSFIQYQLANHLQEASVIPALKYNPAADKQTLDSTKRAFSVATKLKDFAASPLQWKHKSPIFIIGMPRTGSTLIEKILASHPDIVAGGELAYVKDIARNKLSQATGLAYPQNLQAVNEQLLQHAASFYRAKTLDRHPTALRFIDKMPTNFEMLGLISILFPDAYIIHTQRHVIDTLWSCYSKPLSAKYSYRFANLVQKYHLYQEYMSFWKSELDLRILDIQYENLVNDFDTVARQMINFVELPWDDRCLNFQTTQTGTTTISVSQAQESIHTKSIDSWKPYEPFLDDLKTQLQNFDIRYH